MPPPDALAHDTAPASRWDGDGPDDRGGLRQVHEAVASRCRRLRAAALGGALDGRAMAAGGEPCHGAIDLAIINGRCRVHGLLWRLDRPARIDADAAYRASLNL